MKTYPKYKDSGVEWLGEVPAEWEVVQVRYTCSLNDEVLSENSDPELLINYVEISDVSELIGIENVSSIKFENAPSRARRIARKGDVLISTVRTYLKAIANIRHDISNLIVSTGFAVLRPNSKNNSVYLGYLFRTSYFISEIISRSVGVSYPSINATELSLLQIPLPPLPEQRTIAAFLDHEVAKIDELIAEQERLIELLAEKRQATISHAVTKGLDPNAKLKPSGVEWLGDVPEDWEVVPLKYLVRFDSGSTPSKERLDYWDGAIPWASAKDLKSEYLSDTGLHISNNAVQDGVVKIYPAGVVIVLVRGMTLAKTFPVCLTRIPIAINQDLKVLTPIAKISGEYLALALRGLSKESLSRVEEAGHGTKALRMSEWTSMHVPVPPEREQPKLVSQIELFLSRVDSLTTAAREAIALLQERRSSLISAAVTGKIDVRDFVAAEEESA